MKGGLKLKKIAIFIFFLLFFVVANKAQAAGNISLSSNKNTIYVGDEFSISVNLSGASVVTLTTRIGIDTSKVEYVSGPSNSNFSNGKVIYTWTDPNGGSSPISGGTIATFRFKAKTKGVANFSVTGDFYDANENPVSPSFSGKSVTISEVVNTPPPDNPSTGGQTDGGYTNQSTGGTTTTGQTGGTISNTSSNSFLKSLQLNVQGINPNFNKNTTQYYITIGNNINVINVTAVPEDKNAKVSINGNKNLKTGLNKISVLVTAPDNKSKKTYNINVTKTDDPNKANANLENLAVENCVLNPEFNPDVTEYTTELQQDLIQLNILAVPQNQNAKVQITGNEKLQIGENKILITITAEDGTTVKTYNLIVNKKEITNDQNLNEEETKQEMPDVFVEPKKVNKNAAVIPLSILGVIAIIAGICYKKLIKKNN